MKSMVSARVTALFLTLLGAGTSVSAGDHGESRSAVNRIVGLWSTEALVGPCGAPPVMTIRNTLLFNAGGTMVENPRIGQDGILSPPGSTSVYWRGQALGTWTFDPWSRKYFIYLRFDNYVDNSYHGHSIVEREVTLSKRGTVASGPVRSTRYALDGTKISEVCGNAVSTPL